MHSAVIMSDTVVKPSPISAFVLNLVQNNSYKIMLVQAGLNSVGSDQTSMDRAGYASESAGHWSDKLLNVLEIPIIFAQGSNFCLMPSSPMDFAWTDIVFMLTLALLNKLRCHVHL